MSVALSYKGRRRVMEYKQSMSIHDVTMRWQVKLGVTKSLVALLDGGIEVDGQITLENLAAGRFERVKILELALEVDTWAVSAEDPPQEVVTDAQSSPAVTTYTCLCLVERTKGPVLSTAREGLSINNDTPSQNDYDHHEVPDWPHSSVPRVEHSDYNIQGNYYEQL